MSILVYYEPPLVTIPGIYHNPTDGLISLSSDGTNWITIADKNLGATRVYNNGDVISQDNSGTFFQRGNNYGFPFTGPQHTDNTQRYIAGYGPGNYYSSDTFITTFAGNRDWGTPANGNMWGRQTGTNEAMQGPCPVGFHVPTFDEFYYTIIVGIMRDGFGLNDIGLYLKMPYCGYINHSGSKMFTNDYGHYWTSDRCWTIIVNNNTWSVEGINIYGPVMGHSIRPFKNVPVQPDTSWTVLYQ